MVNYGVLNHVSGSFNFKNVKEIIEYNLVLDEL